MADDYYRFLERTHQLRGENTDKTFRLGDRVTVQVIRVDMQQRRIDLGLVEILAAVRRTERARGPRRSKVRPKAEHRQAMPAPKAAGRPATRRRRTAGGRKRRR